MRHARPVVGILGHLGNVMAVPAMFMQLMGAVLLPALLGRLCRQQVIRVSLSRGSGHQGEPVAGLRSSG